MTNKNRRLGRGLGSLMDTNEMEIGGSSSINEIRLSDIVANPSQPRTNFDPEALEELATSIKEIGVISPITLRKNNDGTYMIIAGERRYRASKLVGLKTIPAYVRTANDEQVMEMALIENIQREDLNSIEVALTFYRLMEEYNMTQQKLSERVGKKRATISNYLRLLQLPAEIQMGVKDKKIEMGHAKALLGIDNSEVQIKLYKMLLKNPMSVRKVEELVKLYQETGSIEKQKETQKKSTQELEALGNLKKQLNTIFNKKVKLKSDKAGKGSITIPFKDDDELMQIMQLFDQINK